ncbi:S-adenosyl-L-methionine-dependent methyltransferase [Dipodascopsis uninucleata]
MNLYFDSSRFISPKTSYRIAAKSNFEHLRADIQKALPTLKSDPKRIYALVKSTIRYKELLDDVINNSGILKAEKKLSYNIGILLIHDFLISKTGITAGKGPLKDAILRHKVRLKGEFTKIKVKRSIQELSDFNSNPNDRSVRWFRLNKIIAKGSSDDSTGVDEVVKTVPELSSFQESNEFPPSRTGIYKDQYIPDLYAMMNSQTKTLTHSKAYQTGKLIIQDRASCFPAFILSPKQGDTIIDACAAPGNKTTHLAALMKNEGKIIAFERNSDRATVLKQMTAKAGASIVTSVIGDFTESDTKLNPRDVNAVSKILVDPSCSGSGIFRKDEFEDEDDTTKSQQVSSGSSSLENRLAKLSAFQIIIVKYALTSFPNAARVVYSTCSIHAEENEDVVRALLEDPEVSELGWRVLPRVNCISNWHRRGLEERFKGMSYSAQSSNEIAQGCIRAEPITDGGIGFFAVGFEREIRMDSSRDVNSEASDYSDSEEWAGFS